MIVVVQSIGQIGNRLEQFSHLIAFARDHDVMIVDPAFSLYAEFFEYTHRDLLCRYPSQSAPWVTKALQRFCYYALRLGAACRLLSFVPGSVWIEQHWTAEEYDLGNPHFVELVKTKKFVFLTGTWLHRYWKNYEAHLDATREHFRLVPELSNKVERHFAPIRQAGDVVIGIHIRQGDNFSDPIRRDCFPTDAYIRVMRKIENLFPERRVVFLVCSNEKQDDSLFEGLTFYRGPGSFIEDMYILAKCDYIIGAGQSSFSGWASLMGEKPRYGLFDPEKEVSLSDFVICKGLE
jgi:hypothetical protein